MPDINIGHSNLHYETLGDPSQPTVLLIMGLGRQMIAWPDSFCHSIAAAGYHVIRFDNRDVGLSDKHGHTRPNLLKHLIGYRLGLDIKAPYSLQDMANDSLALLDALSIEKAHLVGISMGGMIAQIMAATAQDRTESLISMMSSSGARHLPLPKKRLLFRLLTPPRKANHAAQIKRSVKILSMLAGTTHREPEEELRTLIEKGLARSHYPQGFIRQAAAIMATGDRSHLLPRITAPTLVIHGKEDPLSPVAGGIDTAEKIPGAKLELIDGLGHTLPTSILTTLSDLVIEHLANADKD